MLPWCVHCDLWNVINILFAYSFNDVSLSVSLCPCLSLFCSFVLFIYSYLLWICDQLARERERETLTDSDAFSMVRCNVLGVSVSKWWSIESCWLLHFSPHLLRYHVVFFCLNLSKFLCFLCFAKLMVALTLFLFLESATTKECMCVLDLTNSVCVCACLMFVIK